MRDGKSIIIRGYRLVDQESYIRGGERNYAAIWIDNTEEYKWGSWYGLTRTQYQEKVNELKSTHMLIDFEAYTSGGSTGYACAWVEEKKRASVASIIGTDHR